MRCSIGGMPSLEPTKTQESLTIRAGRILVCNAGAHFSGIGPDALLAIGIEMHANVRAGNSRCGARRTAGRA
jgi:hypothetical protein